MIATIASQGANMDRTGTCALDDASDVPNTDPQLLPLQDNGGATPTHGLSVTSPARDTGSTAQGADQRGSLRPQGAGPDRGAFELDDTAPDTVIDSGPGDGSAIAAVEGSFTFHSTEPLGSLTCVLDSDTRSCESGSIDYMGLSEGAHLFRVFATDITGNVDASPAERAFVVDVTPPDTQLTGPSGPVRGSTQVFAFTSDEPDATFECRLDGRAGAGAWEPCTSPHALTGLKPGDYAFLVRATDLAGNMDASPAAARFRIPEPSRAAAAQLGLTGTTWDPMLVLAVAVGFLLVGGALAAARRRGRDA